MNRLAFNTSAWTTGEGRDVSVPSEQRRDAAGELVGRPVKFPNRVDHVVVVRVDDVCGVVAVPRDVKLDDPLVRQGANERVRVEVMIEARDVDVVEVKQQTAVGLFGHAGDELPLLHRGVAESHVRAGVLQHERPLEEVLQRADTLHHVAQGLLGERAHWEQVVRVAAEDTRPADVVRNPPRFDLPGQSLELAQVFEVEGLGRTNGERYAVHEPPGSARRPAAGHNGAGPASRCSPP